MNKKKKKKKKRIWLSNGRVFIHNLYIYIYIYNKKRFKFIQLL